MLKRVLSVFLLLSIMLCLTSCSGEPSKDPLIGKWRMQQATDANGNNAQSGQRIWQFNENGTGSATTIFSDGEASIKSFKWNTIGNTLLLTTGTFTEKTDSFIYSFTNNKLTVVQDNVTAIFIREK